MKKKKLLGLSVLSTLVVAGCSCGPQAVTPDTYEVDGFVDANGNKMQFESFDAFKAYLIGSGIISYKHSADYWVINGLSSADNHYNTQEEAINAYLAVFNPDRFLAEQVVFDANGVATSIKMHIDTDTVYKMSNGAWTKDATSAYQSYVDTDKSGMYYTINTNGITIDSKDYQSLVQGLKNEIRHQDATIISSVSLNGVVEGDYILANSKKYIWKGESFYTSTDPVTPMPGAFMLHKGLPYEYFVEHSYTGTENIPKPIFDGTATSNDVNSMLNIDEVVRIYSKDSTNSTQSFAGNRLRNGDYVNGIDYKWVHNGTGGFGKLVLTGDKYFLEDGEKYPTNWYDIDCSVPIGQSKSVYACFSENDINKKAGRLFTARVQETLDYTNFIPPQATPGTVKFTNVDNHADGYIKGGKGTNRAGWYLRVNDLKSIIDSTDCSDLYNNLLTGATVYYDSSNTSKNPQGQLTTSFNESLQITHSNPAGFYDENFQFNTAATVNVDYFAWDTNATYYPTTNALAGSRQLSTTSTDAYVVSNEYWWIGDAVHVTYTTLAAAELAAEQIVSALATTEWRVFQSLSDVSNIYTSSTSYDSAFSTYMNLNSIPQKIVESEYLNGTITDFDLLPSYIIHNPIIVYKIPGYDNYFDSKVDAFNWYVANVGVQTTLVVGTDTYSAKGISASTQDELVQKIWDAYSKKVN